MNNKNAVWLHAHGVTQHNMQNEPEKSVSISFKVSGMSTPVVNCQVVLTTDGMVKVLAATLGEVVVLATGDADKWLLPSDLVYDLWGTHPENPAWHEKLAAKARSIVCWSWNDFTFLPKIYPGKLRTIAEHMGSEELSTLYAAGCPTNTGIFRERGLRARVHELGLTDMNVAQTIPFDPSRKGKLLALYPKLKDIGRETPLPERFAGNACVRFIRSGETMMVENPGLPVALVARTLSTHAAVLLQYKLDGRMIVHVDVLARSGAASLFARDSKVEIYGAGILVKNVTAFRIGTPCIKMDFTNAETINLNDLLHAGAFKM